MHWCLSAFACIQWNFIFFFCFAFAKTIDPSKSVIEITILNICYCCASAQLQQQHGSCFAYTYTQRAQKTNSKNKLHSTNGLKKNKFIIPKRYVTRCTYSCARSYSVATRYFAHICIVCGPVNTRSALALTQTRNPYRLNSFTRFYGLYSFDVCATIGTASTCNK